jgi:hypothetical protein
MVTGLDENDSIFNVLFARSYKYLLKETNPEKVLSAIVDAGGGGTPMTPYVERRVTEHF